MLPNFKVSVDLHLEKRNRLGNFRASLLTFNISGRLDNEADVQSNFFSADSV